MSAAEPLPVAVCSPQPVVLNGLKALLGRHPDRFRIVPPPDGPAREEPDVVLYDVLSLRSGDASELSRLLDGTNAKVIAVSRELRPDLVSRALAAGVDGYFSLGVDEDELVEAVQAAGSERASGKASGESARVRVVRRARAGRLGAEHGLSVRETEVLALVALGLTNKQIAERLFLSINSVKTYVRNAYGKIGAANRSQAVGWAIRHGFEAHGNDG